MMGLPRCERAIVQDIKLVSYLLDETNSKGKSTIFNAPGYEKSNFDVLSNALKN